MRVTLRTAKYVASIAACALVAVGAVGCVSDDSSVSPSGKDGGAVDAGPYVFDASGSVGTPPDDAGEDAQVAPDAGHPGVTQVGLVAGGTLARSATYSMTATTGPATAPVLHSSHYQLVGGMSATSQ